MERTLLEWRSFMIFLLAMGILAVLVFLPYLDVIVLSAAIAVLFEPVYRRFLRGLPSRPGIASFLTVVLIVIILVTPFVYFGIKIVQESANLYAQLANYAGASGISGALDSLRGGLPDSLAQLVPRDSVQVRSIIQTALSWFVTRLGSIFSTLASVAIGFFIMLIAIYYMLKDGKRFMERLVIVSPLEKRYDHIIGEKIYATVNSVVKGSLLVAVVQGVLAGVGFLMFGVPNATLLGAATVIASLVPALGTMLTLVPTVIYLFIAGHVGAAIGLAIWGIAVVGLIDNFIRPHLIRRGVNIHPFLILLSVLGGLHLFGPIGFITGPIVLSLFLSLLDIYTEYVRPQGPAS